MHVTYNNKSKINFIFAHQIMKFKYIQYKFKKYDIGPI